MTVWLYVRTVACVAVARVPRGVYAWTRSVQIYYKIPYYDGCQANIKRKEHQLEQLRLFSEWILSLRGMSGQDTTLTKTCGLKHENKIHKQRLLTV